MEREVVLDGYLDSVVKQLLEAKSRGEHVYCRFNKHILHSDTVTMDSAYLEVTGKTYAEFIEDRNREIDESLRKWEEEIEKRKRTREEEERKRREEFDRQRQEEERIKQANIARVAATRTSDTENITEEKIISGLKFIAENRDLTQDELIDGLIDLGCNFSLDDINKVFPPIKNMAEQMEAGNLAAGATIIVNARDSESGRDLCYDWHFDNDNEFSVYHFIRVVTGDESYTYDNVKKKRAHHFS